MSIVAAVAVCLAPWMLPSTSPLHAQIGSPVTVDDSPSAWELLQRAQDQAATNPAEALRLIDRVLRESPTKLVPAERGDPDRFRPVRDVANELLLRHPELLERYRDSVGPVAERRLEAGELLDVERDSLLTRAGLDASLRLAQGDLEAGRFVSSIRRIQRLAGHPDLAANQAANEGGAAAAHAAVIGGMAAGLSQGDGPLFESFVRTLDELQEGPAGELATIAAAGRTALDRIRVEGRLPQRSVGVTPLDRSSGLPAGDSQWHLLSAEPTPKALFMRSFNGRDEVARFQPRSVELMRARGSLLTVAPTIVDAMAYINEGTVVRAYDRLSGRARWARELPGFDGPADSGGAGDIGSIAASGDSLVTYVGHAGAVGRSGGSHVVCLDRPTGAIRWQVPIARLGSGDELEGLFPHGAPLIDEGIVHVLARKVNNRLESVTYMLALDLRDGSLLWRRHICSSSGVRLGGLRPFSTPVMDGGEIFVAVSTGAVASIDAATGDIRWLRRLPVPVRDPRYESEPWEIAAPLITSAGILTLAPDQTHVLLLSREDGSTLGEFPVGLADSWGQPRYFLHIPAAGDQQELVIAVGSDVACFAVDDLSTLRWALSTQLADEPELIADERRGIRGRVQAVDRSLVVPMRNRVLLVDADSGRASTLVADSDPGIPLVVGPQLLLATHDSVRAFMPFDAAEAFLRERIDDDPSDPDRALALLSLATHAGRLDVAMEAGRLAKAALDADIAPNPADALRHPGGRMELLQRLLRVDAAGLAKLDQEGEALHALIGAVAEAPDERARHLLAYGEWLAGRGRVDEAARSWAEIVGDMALSRTLVADRRESRAAGITALARLGSLRRAQPRSGAAPGRAEADQALAALGTAASTEALIEITHRWPLAPAAIDAAQQAATRLLEEGEGGRALAVLSRLWRAAELGNVDADERRRLAGAVAMTAQQSDAPARAAAFLDEYMVLHGDEELQSGAVTVRASEWRRQLIGYGAPALVARARLGDLSGEAREFPGHLLRGVGGISAAAMGAPTDRVPFFADGAVRLLDADLKERWSVPFEDPDPRILCFDRRGLLLWSASVAAPGIALIEPDEGRVLWNLARIKTEFPAVAGGAGPEQLLIGGQPFDPAEIVPILAGSRLLLVRRSGDCLAIDVRDGTIVWRSDAPLCAAVQSTWADDDLLLIGGADAMGRSVAIAVDPRSGEVLRRHGLEGADRVPWVGASPDGVALAGTDIGVEGFEPGGDAPDSTLWRQLDPTVVNAARAWVVGGWALVADAAEGLSTIRTGTGALGAVAGSDAGFAMPERGEGVGPHLREVLVDHSVIAHFEERVVEFDRAGRLIGMDASADDRDYRMALPGETRLLVVSSLGSEQIELEGTRRTQYVYRVYQLDRQQGCKLIGNALQLTSLGQRFETAQVIDGWLLLSTSSAVTAVPLGTD